VAKGRKTSADLPVNIDLNQNGCSSGIGNILYLWSGFECGIFSGEEDKCQE